mmetsp:Transcript_16180/g.24403  ORF Transcript_16180/g.24403 Transcript_16180/m.24403 type:complete len:155 (-) Transcript_16180:193-657(-)
MSEEKKEKKALRKPVFMNISELEPESRKVYLISKVCEVKTVLEHTRPDGTKVKISEAKIADKSGSVTLTCRSDEHLAIVKQGADLIIRNATVRMYKGYIRLQVDKWGVIEEYDTKWGYAAPPEEKDLNLAKEADISAVEYEEVKEDEPKKSGES